MIANYGYEDGSGFYYITIDTDRCARCDGHKCGDACPADVLVIEADDYDDLVASVAEPARRRLRELCAACKCPSVSDDYGTAAAARARAPRSGGLPCSDACPAGAITHSW